MGQTVQDNGNGVKSKEICYLTMQKDYSLYKLPEN